jgi:LPXTG-motif cell wall-anchored protein
MRGSMQRSMRRFQSRLLVFIACAVGSTFALALPALAQELGPDGLGPPPFGDVVGCDLRVDPPPPTSGIVILVRVSNLTVSGVPVAYDVTLPYDHPAVPFVPFSLAGVPEMQVPGPHHVRAEATWNLGTGVLVLEGDAQCADEPTTTTTEVAPTTAAPPPSVQVKAAEVTAATASTTATDASELPRTGTDSGPLLLLGASCVAIGSLAVRRGRRWRSAR